MLFADGESNVTKLCLKGRYGFIKYLQNLLNRIPAEEKNKNRLLVLWRFMEKMYREGIVKAIRLSHFTIERRLMKCNHGAQSESGSDEEMNVDDSLSRITRCHGAVWTGPETLHENKIKRQSLYKYIDK